MMRDAARANVNLGVVAFLNARPLIEGLDGDDAIHLEYAVPSALPGMLRDGRVDAALVPVIDLARSDGAWEQISDAGIVSDGETLTVRVFSRVPPQQITTLHVDADSHTSILLSRLIWKHEYGRPIRQVPLAGAARIDECESVLLIGDKVVTARPRGFDYEVDLGWAWKTWTGLPFVFAVWAAPAGRPGNRQIGQLLNDARDRGVARAAQIATEQAPSRGWPVNLAVDYLTRHLSYRLVPAARQGMQRFLALAAEENLIAASPELVR